jgi:hypothetical protein
MGNHGRPGGVLDQEPPGMGAASEGLCGAGWGGKPLEGMLQLLASCTFALIMLARLVKFVWL